MKIAERKGWIVFSVPYAGTKRQLQFFSEYTEEAYTLWIAGRSRPRMPTEDDPSETEKYETPTWHKAGSDMWMDSPPPEYIYREFEDEIAGFLVQQWLSGAWRTGPIT